MKQSALEFQISQMRQERMVLALNSIMVFVGALFTTALLPQILFKYLYANAQLTAEPPLLAKIPEVCFAVGALYFIYAVVQGFMLNMKLKALQKEVMNSSMDEICCVDCNEDCACPDHDNCLCGCEDDVEEIDVVEVVEPVKAAEKTKTAAKKKSVSKKK